MRILVKISRVFGCFYIVIFRRFKGELAEYNGPYDIKGRIVDSNAL